MLITRGKVVHTDYCLIQLQQPLQEVGADEPGYTRNQPASGLTP